jgi:hypothetical protein
MGAAPVGASIRFHTVGKVEELRTGLDENVLLKATTAQQPVVQTN